MLEEGKKDQREGQDLASTCFVGGISNSPGTANRSCEIGFFGASR
jgi:hypothetical protein